MAAAADNSGGAGLNANSTTFTLRRPNGDYWNGATWQVSVFNLSTAHAATTSNTGASWLSSAAMPTWASEGDGVYTVQATATDKVGNSFTGSSTTFTLDNTAPIIALVTAPGNGGVYRAATVPATFTGSSADNAGGVGVAANNTFFTLRRPNGDYWNGSTWQATVFFLGTTHAATTTNTPVAWTDNVALPNWAD